MVIYNHLINNHLIILHVCRLCGIIRLFPDFQMGETIDNPYNLN